MATILAPEGMFEDAVDDDGTKHSRLTVDFLVATLNGEITWRREDEFSITLSIKVDGFLNATILREVLVGRRMFVGSICTCGTKYLMIASYDPKEVK